MFSGLAEDRLAIRELLDAYGDAVIRHDADACVMATSPEMRISAGKVVNETKLYAAIAFDQAAPMASRPTISQTSD